MTIRVTSTKKALRPIFIGSFYMAFAVLIPICISCDNKEVAEHGRVVVNDNAKEFVRFTTSTRANLGIGQRYISEDVARTLYRRLKDRPELMETFKNELSSGGFKNTNLHDVDAIIRHTTETETLLRMYSDEAHQTESSQDRYQKDFFSEIDGHTERIQYLARSITDVEEELELADTPEKRTKANIKLLELARSSLDQIRTAKQAAERGFRDGFIPESALNQLIEAFNFAEPGILEKIKDTEKKLAGLKNDSVDN